MRISEQIAVMQSHFEGQAIEWRRYGTGQNCEWWECHHPLWQWGNCDYRVRVEPREPREWWLNEYTPEMDSFGSMWSSKEDALNARGTSCTDTIRVREVIE